MSNVGQETLPPVDIDGSEPGARPKRNVVAYALAGVAILAAVAAVGTGVIMQGKVDDARRAQRAAEAGQKAAEARPPKVVTKNVPVFGRSVLMGILAQGQNQGENGSGKSVNQTSDDVRCSFAYTRLSGEYASIVIDRPTFMAACKNTLTQTLAEDLSR